MLALSFVIAGCGKKEAAEGNATVGGTSSNFQFTGYSGGTAYSPPWQGAYPQQIGLGQIQYSYTSGKNSNYPAHSNIFTINLNAKDVVSLTIADNYMQYQLRYQNGSDTGLVSVNKGQQFSFQNNDQAGQLLITKTQSGSYEHTLIIRRCLDGSNNQINCP